MKRVAILGCGPAGLLCAHAVEREGGEPLIYSIRQKSEIPGSMHLQEHIPGLTSPYPDNTALFVRLGTAEGYAEKVYGDPTRETGWNNYNMIYPSWNVHRAYEALWQRYERVIIHAEVDKPWLRGLLDSGSVDVVISTLPAKNLCLRRHNFGYVPFWIQPLETPEIDRGREVVVFNGFPKDDWYRWSILGGVCSIEYMRPQKGAFEGKKAISSDCDCWPEVIRAGRWANWKHGVLLHHAFHTAEEAMRSA